jgi:hypothetical protein
LCDTIVTGSPEELQVYLCLTLFPAGLKSTALILSAAVACGSSAEALHCNF